MLMQDVINHMVLKSPVYVDAGKMMQLLTDQKMKQSTLADSCGLCRATITGIKNGKPCNVSTAEKISKVLGVEVYEIIKEA